jgi:NAD(P)-dependent dehydrogenase (short-subunit alcohol dehydrogenase family)
MAAIVAAGAFLMTLIGGIVAQRVGDRRHLVLGLAAGLMLGVVGFDLLPEALSAQPHRIFHVPAASGGEAFGVYAASKAAIRSFSRTWANELKHRGIRVNTLVPGPIETPGNAGLAPDADEAAKLWGFFASQVPLGRMGSPEEAAAAALFLAGDQSSFVTGSELYVDGGLNQI